jgi:hypothetical protein
MSTHYDVIVIGGLEALNREIVAPQRIAEVAS